MYSLFFLQLSQLSDVFKDRLNHWFSDRETIGEPVVQWLIDVY